MPKTKKKLFPRNLLSYSVYVEDTSATSEYFNVSELPQLLTGGRNSFLIDGSDYLKQGSNLLIEILDAKGNTIYNTPIGNYYQGTSLLVSIEIYDDTAAGAATIVIMGEIDQTIDGGPIPQEWQNNYNIRWTKKVMVEPSARNKSPIKFFKQPTVLSNEKRYYSVYSASFTTSSIPFTASLTPIINSAQTVGYLIQAEYPTTFSADIINSTITGSLIIDGVSASLNLLIDDVINTSSALARRSVIITDKNDVINSIYLRSGSYTTPIYGTQTSSITSSALLKYSKLTTLNTNVPVSYANLRITDMTTVSGEIFKIRVYNKIATNLADYKLIADIPVYTRELIVTESIRGPLNAGDFYESPNVSQTWYSDTLVSGSNINYPISGTAAYYSTASTVTPFTLATDDSILLSSMYASVPVTNVVPITITNNATESKFSGAVSSSAYFIGAKEAITLFQSTEYTLQLDAFYRKISGSVNMVGNVPTVDIYIIGVNGNKVIDDNPLGQLIGQLVVETGAGTKRFKEKQFNFNPRVIVAGDVGLRFVVKNGFWNFSNISLKPASDVLFSPDEVKFLVPNTEYFTDLLEYRVEFFGIDNNSADVFATADPVCFVGSNIDLGTLP